MNKLLWLWMCSSLLYAHPYYLSICSVIKNEPAHLKEWIEFHRLIGVDHFYLYSSEDLTPLQTSLKSYLDRKIVTLIHWLHMEMPEHWALSVQIPAYENAIQFRAAKTTKWLALLGTDEYLVPVQAYTLTEVLKQYDRCPAVAFETDVFNSSTEAAPSNGCQHFTKLIFKPERHAGFCWPPYQILFKDHEQPLTVHRSEARINRYVRQDKLSVTQKLHVSTRFMPRSMLPELLEQGYALEEDEPSNLFLP